MTRVSDISSHSMMLSSLNRSIENSRDLQVQISTGKVGLNYSDLGRDSQRLISLETERSRIDKFVQTNGVIDLRLEKMETVVAQITELASDAKALLVSAGQHENAGDVDLEGQMRAMLETVAGLLNSEQNGRSLFAGARTDAPPVDIGLLPEDGDFVADTADSFYYVGDEQILRHRASDTLSIDYGVTASDDGFERLIRGLKIAQTTDLSDPEAARLRVDRALDLVNEAVDKLPDIRSRIGGSRAVLEKETSRMEDFRLAIDEGVSDLENVDLAQAISQLSEQEAQMQAALAALARLRQVTLTSFL